MGGALAVSFAAYFPNLISSLVLLAPGGLKDGLTSEYRTLPLRCPKLFPRRYVRKVVRALLNGPTKRFREGQYTENLDNKMNTTGWSAEIQNQNRLNVSGITDWAIDYHRGFIHSITSALKHAPILKQYDMWRRLAYHITGPKELQNMADVQNKLHGQKVLLLLGRLDPLLPIEELRHKATTLLQPSNLEIMEIDGGHAFPITQSELVATRICRFWASQS